MHRWIDTSDIYAVGFDQLIPGNGGPTVNHLRLWSGRGIIPFHIDAFNAGDYATAVREQVEAKNLSRVLYPDDSTPQGKETVALKQPVLLRQCQPAGHPRDAFERGALARLHARKLDRDSN